MNAEYYKEVKKEYEEPVRKQRQDCFLTDLEIRLCQIENSYCYIGIKPVSELYEISASCMLYDFVLNRSFAFVPAFYSHLKEEYFIKLIETLKEEYIQNGLFSQEEFEERFELRDIVDTYKPDTDCYTKIETTGTGRQFFDDIFSSLVFCENENKENNVPEVDESWRRFLYLKDCVSQDILEFIGYPHLNDRKILEILRERSQYAINNHILSKDEVYYRFLLYGTSIGTWSERIGNIHYVIRKFSVSLYRYLFTDNFKRLYYEVYPSERSDVDIPKPKVIFEDINTDSDTSFTPNEEHEEDAWEEIGEYERLPALSDIVGLDNVKERLLKLKAGTIIEKWKRKKGVTPKPKNLNALFIGNTGTGKSMMGEIYARELHSIGLIKKDKCVKCTKNDLVGSTEKNTNEKVKKVIEESDGGILFIDELFMYDDEMGFFAMSEIIGELDRKRPDFCVVLAGTQLEIDKLCEVHPRLFSLFGQSFSFFDYTTEEMTELVVRELKRQGYSLAPDVDKKIKELIKHFKDVQNLGNARFAEKIAEMCVDNQDKNILDIDVDDARISLLTREDIPSVADIAEYLVSIPKHEIERNKWRQNCVDTFCYHNGENKLLFFEMFPEGTKSKLLEAAFIFDEIKDKPESDGLEYSPVVSLLGRAYEETLQSECVGKFFETVSNERNLRFETIIQKSDENKAEFDALKSVCAQVKNEVKKNKRIRLTIGSQLVFNSARKDLDPGTDARERKTPLYYMRRYGLSEFDSAFLCSENIASDAEYLVSNRNDSSHEGGFFTREECDKYMATFIRVMGQFYEAKRRGKERK